MHQPIRALSSAARLEHRFFGITAGLMLLTVVVGFAPSYFLKPVLAPQAPAMSGVVHFHGLLFTAWMILYLVQSALAWRGYLPWHRQLGMLGTVLAAAMLWTGVSLSLEAARLGHTPPGFDDRAFLAIRLAGVGGFAVLVAAGIALRRQPASHKRLIFAATVVLLDPAIGRIPLAIMDAHPLVSTGLAALFWLGLVVFDALGQRRVYAATFLSGLVLLGGQPLALLASGNATWLALAGWWLK